jgi:hypothetical protein
MQFGVIHLETQDSTQPYVALSVLNLVFVSLFWWKTHSTKFSYIASVCRGLYQVFLVGSWMELVFFVLQSKQVGQQFVLSVHCVNFMPEMTSVSLSEQECLGLPKNGHQSQILTPVP